MFEILEKRQLNSKTFDNEDGTKKLEAHAGHIHYFDKLDSKKFRGIDWKLSFDENKRGWGFKYHSFRPFLPEYADEWVEFRDLFDDKDQTIRYKAKAKHVKGRLVMPKDIGLEKETGANCVIYDDAFGEGFDYILYFTRSDLKKVVRVRDKYKGKEELRFTWDIDFGEKEIYRADKRESVEAELQKKITEFKLPEKIAVNAVKAYTFDKTKAKTFDSSKQTLIGNSKLDGKEWFTYLRSFKCWDSGENTEIAKVDYNATDKAITKIITAEFLAKAKGDVFTDTTTSYYSGAGDGYTYGGASTGEAWSTIVNGNGYGAQNTNDSIYAGFRNYAAVGKWNWIYRGRVSFDTSAIPDTATISSAALNLFGQSQEREAANLIGLNVYGISPGSDTSTAVGDFQTVLDTELASTISYTSFSTVGYNNLSFNSAGIAYISKTGYTHLSPREATYDAPDAEPSDSSNSNFSWFVVYNSRRADTSEDPYLEVTYSTAPAPSSFLSQIIMS